MILLLCLASILAVATANASTLTYENFRSSYDSVDPWNVVGLDYAELSSKENAKDVKALNPIDRQLRLAQKKLKYFVDTPKDEEEDDKGENVLMGYNYTVALKNYIKIPDNFSNDQTIELLKRMMPEFDIQQVKLKRDKENNMIFNVIMELGPVNKILGYSTKRLYVQIQAPDLPGAAEEELSRYLSRILLISRRLITIKRGPGNIKKVSVPKKAIHQNYALKKLINDFELKKFSTDNDPVSL